MEDPPAGGLAAAVVGMHDDPGKDWDWGVLFFGLKLYLDKQLSNFEATKM